MDLRYRLAVVTGAGAGLGREIAVALSRAGAGVLSVDRDLAAAERTAELVRGARVGAWTLQVDLAEEPELLMLAARARDLGGMDLLVTDPGDRPPHDRTPRDQQWPDAPVEAWSRTLDLQLRAPMRLTQLLVSGLAERRGRGDGTPAVVNVGSSDSDGAAPEVAAATAGLVRLTGWLTDPARTSGARVMAVVPALAPAAEVTRTVLHLLRHGTAGQVVDLAGSTADQRSGGDQA